MINRRRESLIHAVFVSGEMKTILSSFICCHLKLISMAFTGPDLPKVVMELELRCLYRFTSWGIFVPVHAII